MWLESRAFDDDSPPYSLMQPSEIFPLSVLIKQCSLNKAGTRLGSAFSIHRMHRCDGIKRQPRDEAHYDDCIFINRNCKPHGSLRDGSFGTGGLLCAVNVGPVVATCLRRRNTRSKSPQCNSSRKGSLCAFREFDASQWKISYLNTLLAVNTIMIEGLQWWATNYKDCYCVFDCFLNSVPS